ncbi:MAG: hypothetical protein ACLT3H_00910 [Roseburia sp.]
MKYFLIKTDPIYATAPDIRNWLGVFEKRDVHLDRHHKIKDRFLLKIEPGKNTVFTDLISMPVLMVTEKLRDVIRMYEPTTPFKEVVLLDYSRGISKLYYLPILQEPACLSEMSELTPNRYGIVKAVLDLNKVGEHSIFKIGGIFDDYYVVRLDVAESFLRREAVGISLTEAAFVEM